MRTRHYLRLLALPILLVALSRQFLNTPRAATAADHAHHAPLTILAATSRDGPAFGGAGTINVSSIPVTVDGARTPELIPDHIAYGHFIRAIAQPQKPSVEQISRRDSMLAHVALSDADRVSLVAALSHVREQLDKVAPDRTQESQVLADAHARLLMSLTSDGFVRLDRHIQEYVKKRIVIRGVVPR